MNQSSKGESRDMTNLETAKAVIGVAITGGATGVSYADHVEQWSRIGASWIAIISGSVVIWSIVYNHYKKKKGKK